MSLSDLYNELSQLNAREGKLINEKRSLQQNFKSLLEKANHNFYRAHGFIAHYMQGMQLSAGNAEIFEGHTQTFSQAKIGTRGLEQGKQAMLKSLQLKEKLRTMLRREVIQQKKPFVELMHKIKEALEMSVEVDTTDLDSTQDGPPVSGGRSTRRERVKELEELFGKDPEEAARAGFLESDMLREGPIHKDVDDFLPGHMLHTALFNTEPLTDPYTPLIDDYAEEVGWVRHTQSGPIPGLEYEQDIYYDEFGNEIGRE